MDQDTITASVPDASRRRPGRRDASGVLLKAVAVAFDVAVADIRAPGRGRAGVALARQCAMYLARVALGLTLSETGRLLGRDRTTVAHACSVIEDRRDDPEFDALLTVLETAVRNPVRLPGAPR